MKRPNSVHFLLFTIGTAYLIYLILRAFSIPATIDEAYTVLYHVPRNIWDIITYHYPSPNANNHVLNTLAIKGWDAVLGQNLLSARLTNLMAGGLYVACGIWMLRKLFSSPLAKIAALVLWLENHYLAEFFAIGRGYGMSIGFMTLSICGLHQFAKSHRTKHLTVALLAAWLGVASNFTLLNYYCCLSAILFLLLAQFKTDELRQRIVFFAHHILLALLMYLPITRMMAVNEFEKFGVSGFFEDTVKGFVQSFFMGKEFMGKYTFEIAQAMLVAYFAFATLLFMKKWWAEREWSLTLVLAALLPGTVAVNIAITLLTDAAWLPARTCTFFYPLLVLSLFTTGAWLVNAVSARFKTPLLVLAMASFICFTRVVNLRQSHEWWFDKDTIAVLDYLKNLHQQEHRTSPIRFDSHWMFSNSFKFHLTSNWGGYAKYVLPDMVWRETPQPGDDFEFFYADMKDYAKIAEQYKIAWDLEPNKRALLKKQHPVGK